MDKSSENESDYWDERADEILVFDSGYIDEDYNRTHPLPTREELLEMIKEVEEN